MEMNEEPLVDTAAKIFQELVYSYRSSLMAGLIIAGWDRRKGGQVCISTFRNNEYFAFTRILTIFVIGLLCSCWRNAC